MTLKNIYKKLSKKSDNNLVFCNITDPNVISQKTKTSILSSNLGITKNKLEKYLEKVFQFQSPTVDDLFTPIQAIL